MPRDPLEQNFLVVQNDHQFYLVPIQDQDILEFVEDEDKSEIVLPPSHFAGSNSGSCEFDEFAVKLEDRKDELNLVSNLYSENLSPRNFERNGNLKKDVCCRNICCDVCGKFYKSSSSINTGKRIRARSSVASFATRNFES